jgi:hypothetical protein
MDEGYIPILHHYIIMYVGGGGTDPCRFPDVLSMISFTLTASVA